MADVTQTPTPRRLVLLDGTWVLELESLVPIGENVWRPSKFELRGSEEIIGWLRTSDEHQGLVPLTREILARTAPGGSSELVFDMRRTGWAQVTSLSAAASQVLGRERGRDGLEERLQSAEADVSMLNGRLMSMESQMDALMQLVRSLSDGQVAPIPRAPMPREVPHVLQTEPIQSSPPKAHPAEHVASPPKPPVSAHEPTRRTPSVALPAMRAIDQALKVLIGEKLALADVPPKKAARMVESASRWALSLLRDDDANDVGCIVADLEGGVRLGGGMMMLSPGFIAEQIAHQAPSEEVVEAVSEIFNNICALFNSIKGNLHIRSTPAQFINTPEELPAWLPNAASRLGIEVVEGGWLVLASR